MTVAAQTGLPQLLADKICICEPRIKSGSARQIGTQTAHRRGRFDTT
jgi:hypothetical protein